MILNEPQPANQTHATMNQRPLIAASDSAVRRALACPFSVTYLRGFSPCFDSVLVPYSFDEELAAKTL